MTLCFDLTFSDMLAFTRHYVTTSKRIRRVKKMYMFGGSLFFFVIVLSQLKPGTDAFVGGLTAAILISLIFILLCLILFRRIPARMAKQLSSNPENANLIGFREMTFSNDEIKVKNDKLDVKMSWDMIVKLGNTDTHYLLYTGENQAYIVPKQKISGEEVKTLDALFKAHNLS